jgi:hypothetical protein
MKIYKSIILVLFIAFLQSCGGDKTDEVLLEKDRAELEENLYSEKVLTYKMGKICLRAAANGKNVPPEFEKLSGSISNVNSKIMDDGKPNFSNLSVMDYINLYQDYSTMKEFIKTTDEDKFPTLIEVINISNSEKPVSNPVFLTGDSKIETQNIEHGILSAIVILSRDLGKEVSLYECSKTNPDLMSDNQIKGLLQFYRGFLFFEKKLLYLSENELTNNLNWLDKNPNVDLEIVKGIFGWSNMTNENANLTFNSLNHLFRGFDRLMMEREIDEKRALEDFQAFIDNSEKMGLNNELTAVVESFVYIKQEENQKAIASLKKLKLSPLLANDEKKSIDETIVYLQNREKGDMKNTVVDKFFMTKIATKFIFNVLSKVDWKKVLKEQNVKNVDEIFVYIDSYNGFINNLSKYSKDQVIDKTTNEIKKTGKGLFDKAKSLLK